ncbi:unnamed protein product [Penicillium bialowiezense]
METTVETFALAFTGLILGLAIMILVILVKEWTQHVARQFWPELPSAERVYATDTVDVEAGQGMNFTIEDLTERLRRLEASLDMKDYLVGFLNANLLNLGLINHVTTFYNRRKTNPMTGYLLCVGIAYESWWE